MAGVSQPIQRGRMLAQVLPQAPPTYDQIYVNQLVSAINNYMSQSSAPGDVLGARFIMQDFPIVDPVQYAAGNQYVYPDASQFPNGMIYLLPLPGALVGTYYLTIVLPSGYPLAAAYPHTAYIKLNPHPPVAP